MSKESVACNGLIIVILFLCLFADSPTFGICESFDGLFRRTIKTLFAPDLQWVVLLCLIAYLPALFLLISNRHCARHSLLANSDVWFAGVALVAVLKYSTQYDTASQSSDCITLLACFVFGRALSSYLAQSGFHNKKWDCRFVVLCALLLLLFVATTISNSSNRSFQYHGIPRQSGPWDNPNTFGLLMAVGLCLSFGLMVSHSFVGVCRWVFVMACLILAVLMGFALLNSYSRGACIGLFCGLAYLFSYGGQQNAVSRSGLNRQKEQTPWPKEAWVLLIIIIISTTIVCFWSFQHSTSIFAQRLFSVVNRDDFSSGNRIAGWKGSLQIAVDYPCLGVGWNQVTRLYECYYISPKLREGTGILTNDYLVLGSSLGIPALICFGRYIWLSLVSQSGCDQNQMRTEQPSQENDVLTNGKRTAVQVTCRACAIILVVGCWFDNGLFKVTIANILFVLLELGNF